MDYYQKSNKKASLVYLKMLLLICDLNKFKTDNSIELEHYVVFQALTLSANSLYWLGYLQQA